MDRNFDPNWVGVAIGRRRWGGGGHADIRQCGTLIRWVQEHAGAGCRVKRVVSRDPDLTTAYQCSFLRLNIES